MRTRFRPSVVACLAILVALPALAVAQQATALAPAPASWAVEQQREFLASANIVKWRETEKGVTRPSRVTLSDGTDTHDAAFQPVDIRQAVAHLKTGPELNFRDYYGYNIAAHHLACLIGRCDLVPAAVERRWRGQLGSLTWWVDDVAMDEQERRAKDLQPPNNWAWQRQLQLNRMFTELVADNDRNQTNILITSDWRLVLIDFTRAFRLRDDLKNPAVLTQVEADVLDSLRALDKPALKQALGKWLVGEEINALDARRQALLAHYDALIAAKGRAAVVYPATPPQIP